MIRLTRRRLLGWLISAVAGALIGVWVALSIVLPAVVRRQVAEVLRRAGFEQVKFDIGRATPWETHLSGIASAGDDRLRIESVQVRYSPWEALRGRIEHVHVKGGRAQIDLDALPPSTRPSRDDSTAPPVQRIELESCTVSVRRGPFAAELPVDATLIRTPLGAATVELHGASLLTKGDVEAEMQGIDAALVFQSLNPLRSLAAQKITAAKVKLAGQEFTDVAVTLEAKSPQLIEISAAKLGWCGGELRAAAPIVVTPPSSDLELVVQVDRLDLEKLLAVVTKGRASGTGTISGRIPLHLKGPRVTLWQGRLESDGPGTLRLGESLNAFGNLLDLSDPRYQNDPKMAQVKQQILEALKDFEYDKISAEPTRREAELVVVVHIQGRGRTGARQQLDIVLNLRGLEESLATYLRVSSSVFRLGRR